MTKKSVEKIKNEIKKTNKTNKKINKKINKKNDIQKQDLVKISKTKTQKIEINKKVKIQELNKKIADKKEEKSGDRIENKSEIKSIKLQNIGPFDEKGLMINFGKKMNTKKANIHIFVGENGSGKSTVLREIFKKYLNINPEFKNKTYLYCPNEKDSIVHKIFQEIQRGGCFVINKYYDHNYLEYIKNLENNRNALLANQHKEKNEKLAAGQIENIKTQLKLTEKLEWFIKQIYGKNFKYKYKGFFENYKPFLNGKFLEFEELSLGFYNIICLITDILVNVWGNENVQNLENPTELEFVLLLDEIDIHLHPKAQRRILPALQSLFPNAEIFCTTHSPFVVNSVSDAWVYELSEENYINEKVEKWQEKDGMRFLNGRQTSIFEDNNTVLSEDFNYDDDFGDNAKEILNELFYSITSKKITKEDEKNIEKIRESQNESLKSKLEFLLTKNNFDL